MSEQPGRYDCGPFAPGQVWRDQRDGELYRVIGADDVLLTAVDTWGRVRQFRRQPVLRYWQAAIKRPAPTDSILHLLSTASQSTILVTVR